MVTKSRVSLAVALVVLNVALTFKNIWPTLFVRPTADFSGELALLLVGLTLAWRWISLGSVRTARWLAALWVVLIFGRYVDGTMRSLYGRPIHLYWDLELVPDVSAMFAYVANPWLAVAFIAGLLLVPVLFYAAARWAFGRLLNAMSHQRERTALGLIGVAALVVWIPSALESRVPLPRFSQPAVPAYVRALADLAYEVTGAGERALAAAPLMRSDLKRLAGADVLLVFLESYGAVSWERPEFATALAQSRASLETSIRTSGRSVVSALVESTTFGGESWLAHLSLLAGTEVRDQRTNVRLMAQERDTLAKVFQRGGYRTVAMMPGLLREWPQGRFYGFDHIYDHARLDYAGPSFGWWDVTDQFVLARMDALEVAPRDRQPLFVFFPTITTHAPFTPAPPYQPDWTRVLTPEPYDAKDLERAWSGEPDWLNLSPGYVQSLIYANDTVGGYLRHRADRDMVLILIGDHQPAALITGENASWNVPIHVVANRPEVLDRLRRHGFRAGLAPTPQSVARMDTLLPILLDAFGDTESPDAIGPGRAALP